VRCEVTLTRDVDSGRGLFQCGISALFEGVHAAFEATGDTEELAEVCVNTVKANLDAIETVVHAVHTTAQFRKPFLTEEDSNQDGEYR
jgi:hypothetical protein